MDYFKQSLCSVLHVVKAYGRLRSKLFTLALLGCVLLFNVFLINALNFSAQNFSLYLYNEKLIGRVSLTMH